MQKYKELTKEQERDISDLTTRIKNNDVVVGDSFWIGEHQFKVVDKKQEVSE